MTTQPNSAEFYQMIRENRMAMYSKPRRYFNRDGEKGTAVRYLFFVEIMVFLLLMGAANMALGQELASAPMVQSAAFAQNPSNIYNYNTVYNSGKVFVNWTAKDEAADCIYIIERSGDGRQFESVGVKEGIGTPMELFYSWMDHNPPAGFAYYRVKKISKDGTQFFTSTSTIINQGSSFDQKSNYARGEENKTETK